MNGAILGASPQRISARKILQAGAAVQLVAHASKSALPRTRDPQASSAAEVGLRGGHGVQPSTAVERARAGRR